MVTENESDTNILILFVFRLYICDWNNET